MKKLITLMAITMIAASAHAIGWSWGSGYQVYAADGNGNETTIRNSGLDLSEADRNYNCLGLFYLGNTGDVGGIKSITDLTGSDALAYNSTLGTRTTSNYNTFLEQGYEITKGVENGIVKAGDVFAIFWVGEDGETLSAFYTDKSLTSTYDNTWTVPSGILEGQAGLTMYANGDGSINKLIAYVPVPEPASGALAFAGLAIMVCRRKKQK